MLTKGEYAKVHTYARLAGLNRIEYEDLVQRATGKRTTTEITHAGCDRVLAALEAVLFQRYDEGLLQPSSALKVQALDRYHYRKKLPRLGMANSRLRHKVEQLWNVLLDYLPEPDRNDVYLAAVMHVASGCDMRQIVGPDRKLVWSAIPAETARLTIEALKDRLSHAVADGREHAA